MAPLVILPHIDKSVKPIWVGLSKVKYISDVTNVHSTYRVYFNTCIVIFTFLLSIKVYLVYHMPLLRSYLGQLCICHCMSKHSDFFGFLGWCTASVLAPPICPFVNKHANHSWNQSNKDVQSYLRNQKYTCCSTYLTTRKTLVHRQPERFAQNVHNIIWYVYKLTNIV